MLLSDLTETSKLGGHPTSSLRSRGADTRTLHGRSVVSDNATMRAALLLSVAVVPPMTAGTAPESRRLQLADPYDYSGAACTLAQPGVVGQPDESFYCNSIEGMEQSACTCGSCDQVGHSRCAPLRQLGLPVL